MPNILSKKQAKGVDFCGGKRTYYIIRGDLGYYMYSRNFQYGSGLKIYSMHSDCQGGDHYLSDTSYWYIIKGKKYRRLADMTTDVNAEVFDLHPNCQGGDHYLVAFGWFYIIFQSRGVYRKTYCLIKDKNGTEHRLHPNCRNGLYYWGTSSYFYYVVKDEWGIQYRTNTDLTTDAYAATMPFHHNVMSFLPGGLAVTHGPAFARWDLVETISNDSDTAVTWQKKITFKMGYTKSKLSSTEHNWYVSSTSECKPKFLIELIAKFQFSLTAEYGGANVNTENEDWEKTTEKEETLSLTLEPNKVVYVWQYKLGFGKEDVLFCRAIRLRKDATPPSEVPLPPSSIGVSVSNSVDFHGGTRSFVKQAFLHSH